MLKEKLDALKLPATMAREDMLNMLYDQEYGFPPEKPLKVWGEEVEVKDFWAGKAIEKKMRLCFETEKGQGSFPFTLTIPKGVERPLTAVFISFEAQVPNKYYPAEEIVDMGVAVACFCYNDVAIDKNDGYLDPIPQLLREGEQPANGWAKIALWAWAAQRIADYLVTCPELDTDNLAVLGHSRLGKTALLTAAGDERFAFAMSNDSGCSGASLARNNTGETVKAIYNVFPHWFCPNYEKYGEHEFDMPFDQHFLIKCIEPRHVYVTSASEDGWACPENEYLSCVAAGGMIHPDRLPKPGERFAEGRVGYHLRPGTHFLSRYDWKGFIDFIKQHKK